MGKYKKCPRCELNYIKAEEDLCEVCKKELAGIEDTDISDDVLLDEAQLCPICKVNYIGPGEEMCEQCIADRAGQAKPPVEIEEEPETWKTDEEEPQVVAEDDDVEILSLSQLEADEADWEDEPFDDENDSYDDDKKKKDDLDAEFDEVEEEAKSLTDEEVEADDYDEGGDDDNAGEEVKFAKRAAKDKIQ